MKLVLISAMATAMLTVAGTANACDLTQDATSPIWQLDEFDPFGGAPVTGTFTVSLTNAGDAPCELSLQLLPPSATALTSGAGVLPFELTERVTGATFLNRAGEIFLSGQDASNQFTIPASGDMRMEFRVVVPETNFAAAGDYDADLEFDILDADSVVARLEPTVQITVPTILTARFSGAIGTDSTATVDFEELETGEQALPLAIRLQSTVPLAMTVSSENLGQMKREGSPDWTVPYTFFVDTAPVDLSRSEIDIPYEASTDTTGDQIQLSFQVGDVSRARAGDYHDRIEIVFTPR